MLGEVIALLPVKIGIMFLAAIAAAGIWVSKRSSRSPWMGLLLLFCLAGFVRMHLASGPAPWIQELKAVNQTEISVKGRVTDIREKENTYAVTLKSCYPSGQEGRTRPTGLLVYIPKAEWEAHVQKTPVRMGMELLVSGSPEEPGQAKNPGEFDFWSYYRSLGIHYQMYGNGVVISNSEYIPYQDFLYRFRLRTMEILTQICEPEDLGIFQAALLGEKASLEDSLQELYQKNGIAHLLAISGLHISMIGLGFYRLLRKTGLGYGKAGFVGVAVIISYGVLTGGSSSVVRAVLMVLAYMGAEYLGRSYDMLSAASLAAALLLWFSPWFLFQAGFQLSFGAVAAIGGIGPWLTKQIRPGKLWEPLLLGAIIQITTYPIILYHFFQFPMYGIFLNLLVIPLMTYVLLSGMAGILLGAFSMKLGVAALGGGHYILWLYRQLCLWFEQLPGANLIIGRPRLWQIGLYYALLGVILWQVKRHAFRRQKGEAQLQKAGTENREEGLWGRICRQMLWLCGGIAVAFFLLWPIPVRGVEITFLDVGQGDGTCFHTNKATILIDGGSTSEKELGKQSLEPYLKSRGIQTVDYAIVSHGDADHISGLTYLLEEERGIQIKHLVLPWLGQGEEVYEDLAKAAVRQGGQVHWMKAGEVISMGELQFTCLYHGNESRKEEKNEHSLVLQAEYGNLQILLTGDMSSDGEAEMLAAGKAKQAQLLKVAHHGSKYSSSTEFLKKLHPRWAVISSGEDNAYGHPHKETIERLEAENCTILQTSNSGAILVKTDGQKVDLVCYNSRK